MTLWYAAVSDLVSVHDWASSTPPAPPNDTIILAPLLRALSMNGFTVEFVGPSVSPQIGLQPLPMTKAAVNAPSPPDVTAELSMVALEAVRSTYGATPYPVAADAVPVV